MFTINVIILSFAIIYSLVNLKVYQLNPLSKQKIKLNLFLFSHFQWLTSEKQRSIRELKCMNVLNDFFDRKHVRESIRTLTRSRTLHRRTFLWLFLVAMACYTFQRDERPMTYLYTQLKFSWGIGEFSDFKTFQSIIQNLVLLLLAPLLTRFIKMKDASIAMIGAIAFAIARIFFATANVPWVFYIGGFLAGFGPLVAPMLRSMTSKTVTVSERGKVFALLAVCDQAVPFISSTLYSQVYNANIGGFPYIFVLTAATQTVVFILML